MDLLAHKKIVVVDDEEFLREILVENLADEGAEVFSAENGTLAFDLVKTQKFDAVVTDVRMPGGGGVELIKKINSEFSKEKPALFICSGYNDILPEEMALLKVDHIFAKPFLRENFIKTIADRLKARSLA